VFKIREVYKRVLADTPYEGKQMHANFRVVMWSKFKVDDGIDKNKMKDQIERRFGVLLPLEKVDMIIFRLSYNTIMMSRTGSNMDAAQAGGLFRGKTGMQGPPVQGGQGSYGSVLGNSGPTSGPIRSTLGAELGSIQTQNMLGRSYEN
jgi:hypothetical protein